jgi:hypothetical protein
LPAPAAARSLSFGRALDRPFAPNGLPGSGDPFRFASCAALAAPVSGRWTSPPFGFSFGTDAPTALELAEGGSLELGVAGAAAPAVAAIVGRSANAARAPT